MKCVKNNTTNEIKRVSDTHAEELVNKGWAYIPKKEWKETVRKVAAAPDALTLSDTPEVKKEPKPKKIPGKKQAYRESLRKKRSQM